MVVALAREPLVALWRYATTGRYQLAVPQETV
jgi:hypothetical protein